MKSVLLAVGAQTPPGTQKVTTIFGWAAWVVAAVCVLGILSVGAKMAMSHRRGDSGGEHAGHLGWVLAGCILVGAAGLLVGAITGVNPAGS